MHIYDFLKLYVNRFTIFGKTKIFLGNKTSHKIVGLFWKLLPIIYFYYMHWTFIIYISREKSINWTLKMKMQSHNRGEKIRMSIISLLIWWEKQCCLWWETVFLLVPTLSYKKNLLLKSENKSHWMPNTY